ncbi:MAG: hypothetical protein H6Q52_1023 [Deltaproteobacteria bacterium]|nr:hypothetical protein [Deltaproteobacteria bacterium]
MQLNFTKPAGLLLAPDGPIRGRCPAFSWSHATCSSVGSNILTANPTNGIKITQNIDPSSLGWAVEKSKLFICKEPLKGAGVDIFIVEIFILHMKNHCRSLFCI